MLLKSLTQFDHTPVVYRIWDCLESFSFSFSPLINVILHAQSLYYPGFAHLVQRHFVPMQLDHEAKFSAG